MVESWIDFTLYAAGGAASLLFLFEGTRRLGAHGVHRKAVLMFVVSAAACAAYGGFAYQKYGALNATVNAGQRKAVAKQTVAAWSKVASPERKELLSQTVARQAFRESGGLGIFVDRNGETKTFAPTQEDLAARERVVTYYSRTEFAARSSLAEAVVWLIAGIAAIFLGLFMSLDKPPSPKAQDDSLEGETPPAG